MMFIKPWSFLWTHCFPLAW